MTEYAYHPAASPIMRTRRATAELMAEVCLMGAPAMAWRAKTVWQPAGFVVTKGKTNGPASSA